jgi:hypothetical protein
MQPGIGSHLSFFRTDRRLAGHTTTPTFVTTWTIMGDKRKLGARRQRVRLCCTALHKSTGASGFSPRESRSNPKRTTVGLYKLKRSHLFCQIPMAFRNGDPRFGRVPMSHKIGNVKSTSPLCASTRTCADWRRETGDLNEGQRTFACFWIPAGALHTDGVGIRYWSAGKSKWKSRMKPCTPWSEGRKTVPRRDRSGKMTDCCLR